MSKLDVSHIDIGGCEGCSISVYMALIKTKDINFYSKFRGNFVLKDEGIAIVSGPICMDIQERVELLKEIRMKSCVLIAFGSCSALGGITRYCRGGQQPKPDHMTFRRINKVVDVDYAVPGCPPPPQFLIQFINLFVSKKQSKFIQIFRSISEIKKLSGLDLIDNIVLQNMCIGCGACVLSCPTDALHIIEGVPDLVLEKCIRCGICYVRCPIGNKLLLRGCLK